MIEMKNIKLRLKLDHSNDNEYKDCINDLIQDDIVCSMDGFIQHGDITCLEHSLFVSYESYLICKLLGLDYRSTARGGLLHDFFLYDQHITGQRQGFHCFFHPRAALENANKRFDLNSTERDIIIKHMWPLTPKPPMHWETLIVTFVDKYCAIMEVKNYSKSTKSINKLKMLFEF